MAQQLKYYVEMLRSLLIIVEIRLEENMSMNGRKFIWAYLSIEVCSPNFYK
jgi:hypothetical protein